MNEWVERAGDPFELESANYGVRLFRRDPKRLVTVFASAGSRKVDGFSEEFHSTFRDTGCSIMFVTDRRSWWYNHYESERLLGRLAEIAGEFEHHASIGESLGGCGSILFTNHATHTSRAVAFSPQYSIFKPYISFADGFHYVSEEVRFPVYEDFSRSPIKSRVAIIYGNTGWRDYLHASMFSAAGFDVMTVDGAPHEVAGHLKTAYPENQLRRLAELLTDFDTPFTPDTLRRSLPVGWTDERLREDNRFAFEYAKQHAFNRLISAPVPIPPPPPFALLSQGRPALQSSLSPWSLGKDVEADAAGALNGQLSDRFQFHTDFEQRPWWRVDLERECLVREIRVFNRIDNFFPAARAFDFRLDVSSDGSSWECIHDKFDEKPFGGVDGRPFILAMPAPQRCRFVRFSLSRPGHLHLNQVQVFGTAVA